MSNWHNKWIQKETAHEHGEYNYDHRGHSSDMIDGQFLSHIKTPTYKYRDESNLVRPIGNVSNIEMWPTKTYPAGDAQWSMTAKWPTKNTISSARVNTSHVQELTTTWKQKDHVHANPNKACKAIDAAEDG